MPNVACTREMANIALAIGWRSTLAPHQGLSDNAALVRPPCMTNEKSKRCECCGGLHGLTACPWAIRYNGPAEPEEPPERSTTEVWMRFFELLEGD